jgi:DNA-binding transcriptional LysR family regulator
MYRWGGYMLDRISLDQLRTFIAAVDEGSFSAAGRRLKRAQSMISQTLANLEGQLGVRLFDRGGRYPVLTDQGRALLADARAVTGDLDLFNARAKSLAGELEPELSVAVDVMFPDATFTDAVVAFQKVFPATPLRFDVESSAVVEPVLDGRCAVGGMPIQLVEADLASGALVQISVEGTPAGGHVIAMSAIYRTDSPPGPAGRWFIDHLKQEGAPGPKQKKSPSSVSINSTIKRQRSSRRRPAKKKKPGRRS